MDEEERRRIDEVCLTLLGWTDLEWVTREHEWQYGYWKGRRGVMRRETGSPSQDTNFVVPLAEALRKRGAAVRMGCDIGGWSVEVVTTTPPRTYEEEGDSLPEALATAAARAVGCVEAAESKEAASVAL